MTFAGRLDVTQGTFANGMEYASWGTGPKVLLSIGGGPGSSVPSGLSLRMSQRWFAPFTSAGYTVWHVTRRRNMPRGHEVADVADDYAEVIADELGGRADLVVGVSYGGMVAQLLAAQHGDRTGHVAIIAAAAQVKASGREVDARIADAVARGDHAGAGAAFAEYVVPGRRARVIRRLLGPLVARLAITGRAYPPTDVLVECESEVTFDARAALPGIRVPVILLCGDRDQFFAWDVVEETAALIPDSDLVRYEGRGHGWVTSSKQVPPEVLAFVSRT